MPKVECRKAAKDYPENGIKKGDMYYTWKFRFGGRRRQLKRPRQSQLTQSEFLGGMHSHQETIEDLDRPDDYDGLEEFASEIESIAGEVRDLGSEQEEKMYNMPESLQEGDTGQLLQQRSEQCEEIAGELENAAVEIRDLKDDVDDIEDLEGRIQDILEGVPWEFE